MPIKLASILPELHSHLPHIPEIQLWINVLAQGILSAFKGNPEDLEWVVSPSNNTTSLRWICDHIGIDGDMLQERINAALDGHIPVRPPHNPNIPRSINDNWLCRDGQPAQDLSKTKLEKGLPIKLVRLKIIRQ